MKYSQIKLDLISAGIPQREVLEACKSAGVHVNMAQVNTALDDELCKHIQRTASDLISEKQRKDDKAWG
jgi:hypothetical protein|tara:strand:+ start:258 stop:464 length:207 start_codon:yes stop_codon:yes gene_type:complete